MPLVRISLLHEKTDEYKKRVADAVHQAMVETLNVPPLDRFQVITEHAQSEFVYDAQYLNISRTDQLIMVQITLNAGRSTELKKAFYKRLSDLLAQQVKLRREDLLVNLVEVSKENWSFGNGEAQYAT
jgi:phenylpyruvate tautomerase PptA (4-oxalocrotonate tautomerase family)